jgi:hypothetical protein
MKTFTCTCSEQPALFFENTSCIACTRTTGFIEDFKLLQTFDEDPTSGYFTQAEHPNSYYKKCHNYAVHNVCNGMIKVDNTSDARTTEATHIAITVKANQPTTIENNALCFACQFNDVIPDLTIEGHLPLWKKIEVAKRRALYTLNALPLTLKNADQDPEAGLSFSFTTDRNVNDHFSSKITGEAAVMTGHNRGHITVNLSEADDVARSKTRLAMGERYRTLLGHFRHELGHYYFDQLIAMEPEKNALCKTFFGDHDLSYQAALDRHYKEGPPKNWAENFISEYASMHPWEDWAETWAHYMHIIDTLETAKNYGITLTENETAHCGSEVSELSLPQNQQDFINQTSFHDIIDAWVSFSIMLNSLNRSMGLQDAYPFVLTQAVRNKLLFVHLAIHNELDSLLKGDTRH